MDFRFDPELEAFRREIREFLDQEWDEELGSHIFGESTEHYLEVEKPFFRKLAQKRWLGLSWPEEYGGGGKTELHHFVLAEELTRQLAPFPTTAAGIAGPTILRYGTDEQKQEWLPRITSGETDFALGYSEPNAGTDLASLEIRAVLDGDDYVINGTKIFNSAGHRAEYEWLAVRTDINVPKHRGISLIIVPIDSPGIIVSPLWTMGDGRTNQVYFNDVRVPRKNLIGELNRGWYYVATALDFERVAFNTVVGVRTIFEGLVRFLKETSYDGQRLADDPAVRNKIAQLSIDLEVAQLFNWRCFWLVSQRIVPNYEASMLKIFRSEFTQRLYNAATQMLGLYGQLAPGSKWAPLGGLMEQQHRASVIGTFGAGSNEIQRNIIAVRGLGLPRG